MTHAFGLIIKQTGAIRMLCLMPSVRRSILKRKIRKELNDQLKGKFLSFLLVLAMRRYQNLPLVETRRHMIRLVPAQDIPYALILWYVSKIIYLL